MTAETAGEKPHEPTQRKLEEARRQGDVPHSADLAAVAAQAGLLAALLVLGPAALERAGRFGARLLADADRLAAGMRGDGQGVAALVLAETARLVVPFAALPAAAALAALAVQRALVVAPARLAPRLSRISPLAALAHRFGPAGLFEFAKGLAKLVILSTALAVVLAGERDAVLAGAALPPAAALAELLRITLRFLVAAIAVLAALAAADWLFQVARHRRQNRMSRQELIDEWKQTDGDPQLKAQRRRRAFDIATNRMLRDVPKADVVIVNPTHYAVALRWSRASGRAPVCVAKGVDEVAARIRTAAALAGVPIRHDPPTARTLHATVDLGEEIRPEHYRAVAAAIRFAEAARRRARARHGVVAR
jgi:flagellar biosynthetic protein FlhB